MDNINGQNIYVNIALVAAIMVGGPLHDKCSLEKNQFLLAISIVLML